MRRPSRRQCLFATLLVAGAAAGLLPGGLSRAAEPGAEAMVAHRAA